MKSFLASLVVSVSIALSAVFGPQMLQTTRLDNAREATKLIHSEFGNGSGVLVAPNHVVTAAHVGIFFKESKFPIFVNNKKAKLLKIDEELDIALLYVEGMDCPCVPIAKDAPAVGDKVYAIGFPAASLTGGMRVLTEGEVIGYRAKNRVMSTTWIAPGNSGGALVNAKGELVGIVVEVVVIPFAGMFPDVLHNLARSVDLLNIKKFLGVKPDGFRWF